VCVCVCVCLSWRAHRWGEVTNPLFACWWLANKVDECGGCPWWCSGEELARHITDEKELRCPCDCVPCCPSVRSLPTFLAPVCTVAFLLIHMCVLPYYTAASAWGLLFQPYRLFDVPIIARYVWAVFFAAVVAGVGPFGFVSLLHHVPVAWVTRHRTLHFGLVWQCCRTAGALLQMQNLFVSTTVLHIGSKQRDGAKQDAGNAAPPLEQPGNIISTCLRRCCACSGACSGACSVCGLAKRLGWDSCRCCRAPPKDVE
jgi:hypothetical protein